MAEFALGLTKTAVESTVSLVKSAVEEEAQLKVKVQNDLVFISDELEMVQSFLRVANNNRERARNDQVVLTWVRQLRCLAFDVEDCIEFVLHLDLKSRWAWLRRAWQKVYCCAPPLPLDTAIAEIKQLKARVEDVSHRNTRYNFILHDSNSKTVPAVMPPAEEPSSTAFDSLRDAWKATGKWSSNKCNLQQELLIAPEGEGEDGHDLRVISVWGSTSTTGGGGGGGAAAADLGTASIFRKAYCDPEICEKFRSRSWVKLTPPFNHDEFVKSLLTQFCATSHQADAEFTEGNLRRAKKAMMQQMRRQRYLVVLEDVLTVAEWDVIRMYLPDSKNGSRILLSTPQLGIALLCTGEPYQVSELRNFSTDNQFLCAFSKKEKEYRSIISTQKRYQEAIHWVETCQLVGRDSDMIIFSPRLNYESLVSVWGVPGVGKSTLVRTVYCKIILLSSRSRLPHSSYGFYEAFTWVDVPSPFNLTEFAWRLLLDFYSDDPQAKETATVSMVEEGCQGPIIECCKILHTRKCLAVIDGLRSKQDWDLIKTTFLAEPSEGCVVVITNEEEVAMHCVENEKGTSNQHHTS